MSEIPSLRLFRANGRSSLTTHILLNYLNIPFDETVLELGAQGWEAADGSLSNAQYKATVNPAGLVPALVLGGQTVVTESTAVLSYLASLKPEAKLQGETLLERAQVLEWLAWLAGTVHGYGVAMYFAPNRFADDEASHPALKERGLALSRDYFQRIDKHLAERAHPVGERETLVDFNLIIIWFMGVHMGIDMEGNYAKFGALVHGLLANDVVQKTLKDEGLMPAQ